MTVYTDLIYPDQKGNRYPEKLVKYLQNRFFESSGKLLDVGCGNGATLKNFAKFGHEIYGIDLRNEQTIENFKECNLEEEKIPYPTDFFDYVYSKSVIEHVFNTTNFLSEIHRVLKPNGKAIILVPDWKSQIDHYWDDYTHVKPFTRKSLRDAYIINGFSESNCEYFYQLPFVWDNKKMELVPKLVDFFTFQAWKWKNESERNGQDRKLIRFSKEKMLLSCGVK